MNGKRHTPEQIIHRLRQAEVELGQGATVPQPDHAAADGPLRPRRPAGSLAAPDMS